MLVNMDMLTDLTGVTRRTITKKLINLESQQGKGRSIMYESKEALPLLMTVIEKNKKSHTLEFERTRLAKAQADNTELDVEVKRGNLIPSETVEEVVNNMLGAFRSRLMALPTKAAPDVVMMADVQVAESLLRDYVNEALQELSEYDSEQYSARNDKQVSEAGSTTAKADGKRVGRPKEKAIEGSKRRKRTVEH